MPTASSIKVFSSWQSGVSVNRLRDTPYRLSLFSGDEKRGRFGQRFLLTHQLLLELINPLMVILVLFAIRALALDKAFVRVLACRAPCSHMLDVQALASAELRQFRFAQASRF